MADAGLLWGHLTEEYPRPTPALPTRKPAAKSALDVLQAVDVSKSFNGQEVLSHINLVVHSGEILALVGPSGCGKSTLLNILAGLLAPDSGCIHTFCTGHAVHQGLSYMFQEDRLLPWRTVADNVALGLEAQNLSRNEIREKVLRALSLVGLTQAASLWPHELSGGMRSRVALARSLAVRPSVLLMDEPFSRLDPHTREQMHAEVLRLHEKEKVTVVLVTHDMEEAVVLADRIVRLIPNPGRIAENFPVAIDRPRLLTDEAVMQEVRSLRLKV